MASGVKIKLKRGAVAKLLNEPRLAADLRQRAERIAMAAGPGMEAESGKGSTRVRASVVTTTPEAMLAEAKDRALTRALNAGRG